MKKWTALLLALVLVLSMCAGAAAEEMERPVGGVAGEDHVPSALCVRSGVLRGDLLRDRHRRRHEGNRRVPEQAGARPCLVRSCRHRHR